MRLIETHHQEERRPAVRLALFATLPSLGKKPRRLAGEPRPGHVGIDRAERFAFAVKPDSCGVAEGPPRRLYLDASRNRRSPFRLQPLLVLRQIGMRLEAMLQI